MANNQLIQFIGAILVLSVLVWFSNISEDTGNVGVAFIVLLWLVWGVKNGGNVQAIAAKVGI